MRTDELIDRIAEKVNRMRGVSSVLSGDGRMEITLTDGRTVALQVEEVFRG